MYAVLDIETTGGKYDEEGITEIAIYRFDGEKINILENKSVPLSFNRDTIRAKFCGVHLGNLSFMSGNLPTPGHICSVGVPFVRKMRNN